ncbi:MAG: ArsR/SmtB family transcription factor [Microbacteriaceae bacterium]
MTMISTDAVTGHLSAVALFRSLGDPARLAIVQYLVRGEARVGDLMLELRLAQSTVSAHIACLRDCGLVAVRAEGRKNFYSLTRPELMVIIAQAESLLLATGNAVSACPVYGTDSAGENAVAAGQQVVP